jgi:hypothetical protein
MQPLNPTAAFAAARNPQFAPMLNQQAQAPEMARYGQQQAAFEAAMSGRQQAMQTGASLVGGQNRMTRANRPQLRMVQTVDAQGNPVTVPMEYDPATGTLSPMETTAGQGQFPKFVPPRTLSSPTGFQNMDPVTGKTTPVTTQGGAPVYPQPPAGVVSDIAAGTANLQGLEALRSAYQKIRSETTDSWDATKVVGTMAGETRLGGMLAPNYASYTASRRASLNAYIKSVTGAQFSVAELQRYEGQYPEPWDDEALAEQKIQALSQRAIADMQAKMRAFPGSAGAGPQVSAPQSESIVDKALRLAEERRRANPR